MNSIDAKYYLERAAIVLTGYASEIAEGNTMSADDMKSWDPKAKQDKRDHDEALILAEKLRQIAKVMV